MGAVHSQVVVGCEAPSTKGTTTRRSFSFLLLFCCCCCSFSSFSSSSASNERPSRRRANPVAIRRIAAAAHDDGAHRRSILQAFFAAAAAATVVHFDRARRKWASTVNLVRFFLFLSLVHIGTQPARCATWRIGFAQSSSPWGCPHEAGLSSSCCCGSNASSCASPLHILWACASPVPCTSSRLPSDPVAIPDPRTWDTLQQTLPRRITARRRDS